MSFHCEFAAHKFQMYANTHTHTDAGNLKPGVLSSLIKHATLPASSFQSPTVTGIVIGRLRLKDPLINYSSHHEKCGMELSYNVTFKIQGGLWTINPVTPNFINSIPSCPVHHSNKHRLSSLSAHTTCGFPFSELNGAFLPPSVINIHLSRSKRGLSWFLLFGVVVSPSSSPTPALCLNVYPMGGPGDWTHMLAGPICFNKLDWRDWKGPFGLNDTRAQQGKNLGGPRLWSWLTFPPPLSFFSGPSFFSGYTEAGGSAVEDDYPVMVNVMIRT